MNFKMIELTKEQVNIIEEKLEAYDEQYTKYPVNGKVQIGIEHDGRVIAGVDAVVTTFKILYVSTVYVDEDFRGQGLGRRLMKELEARAVEMGVNTIRLDTFDWQGSKFYPKIGYEEVGCYQNEVDGYSEHFFVKRLYPLKQVEK